MKRWMLAGPALLTATLRVAGAAEPRSMDANEALRTARALGLTLPTPAYLFGAIVFGLAGLAAWRIGRKEERPRTLWIGVTLMLYPYLVSQTWLLYALGVLLCAGIWWDRP